MDNTNIFYDLTSADSKIIGFEFQYFFFISKLLHLQEGEKIGFEARDDVHIETGDSQTLFQLKHSTKTKANGSPVNLTDLDEDLWKTISHWVDIILSSGDDTNQMRLIKRTQFVLATNKDIASNAFVKILELNSNESNKQGSDVIKFLSLQLSKTGNETIKGYIKKVMQLSCEILNAFIGKIEIINTGDSIIEDIKMSIRRMMIHEGRVNDVFNSLLSELKQDFFNLVKRHTHQEIIFDEWINKYSVIFENNRSTKLPIREFRSQLPANPFELPFIAELIDIGEIDISDIDEVADILSQRMDLEQNLKSWHDEGLIVNDDISTFHQDAKAKWKNCHKASHRLTADDITDKQNALTCLDEIRKIDLLFKDTSLHTKMSNGEFYYLADRQWIGWRKKWNLKYNT